MKTEVWNAIASCVAAAAAVIGFIYTVKGLNDTAKQLQANNEYEIRRDLRAISREVDGSIVLKCILKRADCDASELQRTRQGYTVLMNFFVSIHSQSNTGGVSTEFEDEIARDFCRWVKTDFGVDFWERKLKTGDYGKERFEMKSEWCK